ncbi:hypothetical protein QEN19_002576 [Hanseniaspora menglaensis]
MSNISVLKQHIPELVVKTFNSQFELDNDKESTQKYDSTFLCDFVNSLIFTLVSCSNNKNNNNNLFISTDDLLMDFNLSDKHNKEKNMENIKVLETGLIHDLIQFMSNIPNFLVNIFYISDEYTPNDDDFMKNIKRIEEYYKSVSTKNTSAFDGIMPEYQICLIVPKFKSGFITETTMQNRCAMKINYLLNRIQQLNANLEHRNSKKQSVGIVISSLELLNKNVFLTKKFWLSCPSKNTINFLNSKDDGAAILFTQYMNYIYTRWEAYKQEFNIKNTFKFNHMLKQYILDIVVHLRMHRFSIQGKSGGISSISLNDMMQLSILLAITYELLIKISDCKEDSSNIEDDMNVEDEEDTVVTPDIVKIASRWYFPFKLQLTYKRKNNLKTKNFRKDYSVQFGSDKKIVDELISNLYDLSLKKQNGFGIGSKEDICLFYVELLVVDEVLKKVSPPF